VKAAAQGPQTVKMHGKAAAVVLSPQSYVCLKNAQRQPLSAELLRPRLIDDADEALFERHQGTGNHCDVLL